MIIELGVGSRKEVTGSIGVDINPGVFVDHVGEGVSFLTMQKDNSVDSIYARHFLCHLDDYNDFFIQCSRVLKSGGTLYITAPHHSNSYYYSDPTHRSFFGLYTVFYFLQNEIFIRKVPRYTKIDNLHVKDIKLVFKSDRHFLFTYILRKSFGAIFNSCRFMQEKYEDIGCKFLSCYEVKLEIVKND